LEHIPDIEQHKDDGAVVLGVVLGRAMVGLMDIGAEVLGVELGIAVVGLTDGGSLHCNAPPSIPG
jgi:hypothetical protein